MLKVVLVDDEIQIRKGLEHMVAWEKLGLQIIGNYSNALEALDGMTDEMPDILVTDIKMPVMNGIELISRTKKMYPLLECIILSGYGEFALAQAAMSEGVKHYLLKPCTKEKAENVLKECIGQIKQNRAMLIQDDNSRKIVIDKLVTELMALITEDGIVDASDVEQIMSLYKDISILREAAVLFIVRYLGRGDYEKRLSNISQIFENREQIYRILSEGINELCLKNTRDNNFIDKIKKYVDENHHMPNLTLQFVAENVVHMNAQYAGKQFYKQTGMKFSEYLLQVRMENAKKMLNASKGQKMYEIAENIGLGNDIQYFYQLFKKYTGMTPKEWRENTL